MYFCTETNRTTIMLYKQEHSINMLLIQTLRGALLYEIVNGKVVEVVEVENFIC